jgi:outer membrane protein TolC
MPLALEVEKHRLARTQREVAMDVLKLAGETRVAYYSAVAAEEGARYMRKVMEAAEASAELARRMARIGSWSKLNQAREHSFYADATLQLAKAENNATVSREQLTRLMGLWGSQIAFRLPERLPELPKEATDLPSVESAALDMRLDLNAAKLETEALARNLGLAKATRFINVLEFGPARVLEGQKSDPYKKGYEVSLELPIFDWGSSKVAKAEAIYMQAVERTAEMAVNARSEVREAYKGYRVSFDIARHYRDEIVPLRKRIADENLLRYNGMLIGIFELLADARSQIASVNSSVEATRDFWIASSNLAMALIGKPSLSGGMAVSSPRAADAGNH